MYETDQELQLLTQYLLDKSQVADVQQLGLAVGDMSNACGEMRFMCVRCVVWASGVERGV
jgi:hypothetical protein